MNRKRLVIIGAGGFAREVRMLAEDITNDPAGPSEFEFAGYVVSAPVSGRVSRIELHEGDTVKQAQVVAEIWPVPLTAR